MDLGRHGAFLEACASVVTRNPFFRRSYDTPNRLIRGRCSVYELLCSDDTSISYWNGVEETTQRRGDGHLREHGGLPVEMGGRDEVREISNRIKLRLALMLLISTAM